jgi:hypothetical protein
MPGYDGQLTPKKINTKVETEMDSDSDMLPDPKGGYKPEKGNEFKSFISERKVKMQKHKRKGY